MDETRVSVAAQIIGRVQGVGFRAYAAAQAAELGLSGSVANERDGSVRAVLTGSEQAVNLMLERLRKGPPGASVDRLVTAPADAGDTQDGFRILR